MAPVHSILLIVRRSGDTKSARLLHKRMTQLATFLRRYSQTTSGRPPIMANDMRWTAAEVRKTFLDFFAEREHTIGNDTFPRSDARR